MVGLPDTIFPIWAIAWRRMSLIQAASFVIVMLLGRRTIGAFSSPHRLTVAVLAGQ
jgi:hypothetical protein